MSSSNTPLQHIQAATAELSTAQLDEESRKSALFAARQLVSDLEAPPEKIARYAFDMSSQRMSLRVALDMGIFPALAKAEGQPLTAQELADACKAEKLLVVRLLRVLTAIGFVAEAGHEVYRANQMSFIMADPTTDGVYKASYDLPARVQAQMQDYFKDRGYKSPVDAQDGPLQYVLQTKLEYFDFVQNDPELLVAFNALMTQIRNTRKHWTEWYPVQSQILDGVSTDSDEMVLIDMGGARGHDLETFLKKFPSVQTRLMLQDLPKTIETVGHLAPHIKAMVHDFFTPQPVKGARVYFMHFVMHDWPDDKCREILRQIKPALKPGYSKILLNEIVLPDQGCPAEFAAFDINMMSVLSGMERSRTQWIELVESVGLHVVDVHTSPFTGDAEGVVEIMLKT